MTQPARNSADTNESVNEMEDFLYILLIDAMIVFFLFRFADKK